MTIKTITRSGITALSVAVLMVLLVLMVSTVSIKNKKISEKIWFIL